VVRVFEDEEDFAAETVSEHSQWQRGDRVRIIGGSPQLVGAVGSVVGVGLPGRWTIRVELQGRRGFGKVLRAADELEAEGDAQTDEATP
jgi:hypothetical protein